MKKQFRVVILVLACLGIAAVPLSAQVSTTGPAGLARQMPRIYGPHMANVSRVRNQQKHKVKNKKVKTTRKRNHRH
jgi:hypothetical protein